MGTLHYPRCAACYARQARDTHTGSKRYSEQLLHMRRIITAVDCSEVTDAIVANAAALAHEPGDEIWLIHVASNAPGFIAHDTSPAEERAARARELRGDHRALQAIARRLREAGVRATALLLSGDPAEKILRTARRLDAQLIVIGSHGHSALYNALLGSVSHAVVRCANIPVLVVPAVGRPPC